MQTEKEGKILGFLIGAAALVTAALLGVSFYLSSSTIDELLSENRRLGRAIENLSAEEQIGYATVQKQQKDEDGRVHTTIRLVQTAPGRPRDIVSEQAFTVVGQMVHFDCLVVKFSEPLVLKGEARALYLWRRIYGEATRPENGQPIEVSDSGPERYYAITKSLRMNERSLFWEAVWDLADDPDYLAQYGVQAVFGNTVYLKMRPGKVYRFKINASGQIYPEVIDAS